MDMSKYYKRFVWHGIALILLAAFSQSYSFGAKFYKWVDEEGTVHMTDDLSQIPPQYRHQVEEKRNSRESARSREILSSSPVPDTSGRANSGDNLKSFEVPYEAFEGTARRIIIPVTFNGSITAPMLLDTGSPGLLISPDLAGRLNLVDKGDAELLITASGIGGSVPATLIVIDTVSVGGASAEFLPATVADVNTEKFEGLVGMDFMTNYQIAIDVRRSVISFNELPVDLDRPGGHDEVWWRSNFVRFAGLRDTWKAYLKELKNTGIVSSETEKLIDTAQGQYDEANRLYRKLDRFARDNNVPTNWRRE
jgi:hypothetical protein